MFKQLFLMLKSNTLMDQAYKRSYQMLDITHKMFIKAKSSLRESESVVPELDVSEMDIKVNRFERKVRRKIFRHLAVAGAENIYSSLVLISIIIDIERVGDYTKNIVELAANYPSQLILDKGEEDLKKIESAIEDQLRRVRNDFETGDANDAEKLLREYIWINPLCDEKVMSLIKREDHDISTGKAVTLALYYRYLKRINAHLQNVATSLVNPFDKIGFLPKEIRKELNK